MIKIVYMGTPEIAVESLDFLNKNQEICKTALTFPCTGAIIRTVQGDGREQKPDLSWGVR